jgi:hypothetical protein
MDESGGSESALVGSGNSSSQAKDEMLLNFIQSLPEGQRYTAFTKYMETEQAREQTKQEKDREETKRIQEKEREETKRIQLLRVGERAAAVTNRSRYWWMKGPDGTPYFPHHK